MFMEEMWKRVSGHAGREVHCVLKGCSLPPPGGEGLRCDRQAVLPPPGGSQGDTLREHGPCCVSSSEKQKDMVGWSCVLPVARGLKGMTGLSGAAVRLPQGEVSPPRSGQLVFQALWTSSGRVKVSPPHLRTAVSTGKSFGNG